MTWRAVTWDAARAAGITSYLLLTACVALGLVLGQRWQWRRWPRVLSNEAHGYLALLALVFIVVHVSAVAIDPFTRFGLGDVLVPFVAAYRPLWLDARDRGPYLLLAVWLSTRLRARSASGCGGACTCSPSPCTPRPRCTDWGREATRDAVGGRAVRR